MAQSGVSEQVPESRGGASFVTALTQWKLCVQILFICAQHVTQSYRTYRFQNVI